MSYGRGPLSAMPPVVKNILILNVLMYGITVILGTRGFNLAGTLGMFYVDSPFFRPWQFFTHLFMHGSFMHLFFNMFGVWMFGTNLERVWGGKRFIIFYLLSAVGAIVAHQIWNGVQLYQMTGDFLPYSHDVGMPSAARQILQIPTVGASGALFGILGGFAMLFPNTEMLLIFFPVPIKAKYFVAIYAAIELFSGFGAHDNIAHFAHLGGLAVGLLLVWYWNKNNRNTFY